MESFVVTIIKSGLVSRTICSKSEKVGQFVPIYFLPYSNLPGLISQSPTNSRISEYSYTNRLPQKLVPLIPVPTNAIFSFLSPDPKPKEFTGNAATAASMLTDFKYVLLEFFIFLIPI